MLLDQVAATSRAIAGASSRKKKVSFLSALLREVPGAERAAVARYLAGETGYKTGIEAVRAIAIADGVIE